MAEFVEPTGSETAGFRVYSRPHSPYERWMEEEAIPIIRGIGVRDARDVTLGDWGRRNARGAYLYLSGIENSKGMYVLEVPERRATNPEKHMYDEFFFVVEGRGTTEVWRDDSEPMAFEWQPGTLFTIPINATYRLINAGAGSALLLSANNAPVVMNVFQNYRFIFENDWDFSDRYDLGRTDMFSPNTELETDPVRGRASIRSNIFPDIVGCDLPLDNQRAPGYRRINPRFHGYMHDGRMGGFVAEYPAGRYSKAHYHMSGAVLVCLKGKGYTLSWPVELGPTPWTDGHGDGVNQLDYVPGGLVAAAPGGGSWFHQHFGIGKEGLRTLNFWGGPTERWGQQDKPASDDGETMKAGNVHGINEGGRTILYEHEDPFIRTYYEERLAEEGQQMTMSESLYSPSPGS